MHNNIAEITLEKELAKLRAENQALKHELDLKETKLSILTEENQLLRVFEEDYKAISNQTLVGILIAQDGRYVFVSDGFAATTGYTVATVLSMSVDDMMNLVHPEEREDLAQTRSLREAEGNKDIHNMQFRLRKKSGGYVWLETWSKQISYRGRRASIITYVDISEKQEYQRKLHESKELYSNLFFNSPAGLIYTDTDGKILKANSKILEMMGSPSMEATSQINLFTFPPIVECGFADLLKESIEEGRHKTGTTYYKTKWGKTLWINYHFDPIRDTNGEISGTLINFIDVTEEYKATRALKSSEEKLGKIFQSSPNAIAVINRNGYIVNCNERQVLKFGYTSKADIIGLHSSALIPQDVYRELKSRIINADRNTQRIPNYECKLSTFQGDEFYAEISGGMILDDNGKPSNFIAVTQDITQRKFNEKELILAKNKAEESDRLKTAFLENMSHEIRTPLNGIIGFLDILTDDDVSLDEKTEFVDIIHNCSNQLLTIINDILEVSKITSGQLQVNNDWVDIKDLMNEILTYYNAGRIKQSKSSAELNMHINMKDMHTMVFTDAERLRQVFTNLINNALKFCPEGEISLSCQYTDELGLLFSVTDTGIGIPQEKQELIFERFRQVDESMSRKYGGTGLGLAICRSIVEILGGTIWVESTPGKGSSFYFTLPYDPDHVSEVNDFKLIETPSLPGKKVLFIDQSKIAFDFLRISLRSSGIDFTFASGAEEVNMLFENGNSYDLIFGDAELLGMNDNLGFERIAIFCPNTPVVVMGNERSKKEFSKPMKDLNSGWINKPFNKSKVALALQQFLISESF